MNTRPELSRPLTLDAARRTRSPVRIAADASERAALAQRFDLVALDRLEAELSLAVEQDVVTVTGHIEADVTQACVATGVPLAATIDAPLLLRLVSPTSTDQATADAEVELDAEDCDTIEHDGGGIDLGEIVAQSLALALNPWPRSAGADAALKAAGVRSEEEAGAFGALAALRDKLGR